MVRDKELKLEDVEGSHTLEDDEASHTLVRKVISRRFWYKRIWKLWNSRTECGRVKLRLILTSAVRTWKLESTKSRARPLDLVDSA